MSAEPCSLHLLTEPLEDSVRCHRCERSAQVIWNGRLWCSLHANVEGDKPYRRFLETSSRPLSSKGLSEAAGPASIVASVAVSEPGLSSWASLDPPENTAGGTGLRAGSCISDGRIGEVGFLATSGAVTLPGLARTTHEGATR